MLNALKIRLSNHFSPELVKNVTGPIYGKSGLSPEKTIEKYLAETPVGKRGLNLGCGGATFDGWINVDEQYPHHVDVLWDIGKDLLSFVPDGTFDYVYSEHFMEHINRKAGLNLMKDSMRVLRKGGHVRIAMPDLDKVLNDYHQDNKHRDVHDSFKDFYGELFYTRGELLDIAMRAWGHTYLYNEEDLILLLKAAGFTNVKRVKLNASEVPMLANRETRPVEQSGLIAEGTKQ